MKFFTLSCLMVVLVSCNWGPWARDNKEVSESTSVPESLIAKGELYCSLELPRIQSTYVAGDTTCDASGFTSLHSLNCPEGVDLSVFTDDQGKLYRTPTHDCFIKGESKSESSRDMHLMRMLAAFEQKDLAYINATISYGEKNKWVMCDAVDNATLVSRCVFTPELVNLIYDVQEKLEPGIELTRTRVPVELTTDESDDGIGILPLRKDFEAHLEVLKIYLAGRVHGGITNTERDRLKAYVDRESENALYRAVLETFTNGDFSKVVELLNDEARFPQDDLPTSENYCTHYLYQRDMLKDGSTNPDWVPCPAEKHQHSATEFGLALYVSKRTGR